MSDMGLRASLPAPVRGFVRTAYVGVNALTASRRAEPDFLLVGGQRCGTTSLFRAFEQHPQIVRPTLNKGVNYFDLNYHRGPRWYRAHFPLEGKVRDPRDGPSAVFEASGYYMFHPLAPERIARDLPNVKIVAMLRDPVERAFSAWKHESARGFDTVSFEDAIETEDVRTRGERERMIEDPNYQSFAYRHFSYTARGDYVSQLRAFYDRLPASNIHVVYSEDFFVEPQREFALLLKFLKIDNAGEVSFEQHNARPSGPMPGRSREMLTERYRGQAEQLEHLVGRVPPWAGSRGGVGGTQM